MKPIHGSFGRNIHQIFYSQTENCYYCRYRENEENKLRKYQSLETLLNHVLKGHDLKSLSYSKVFRYFASMGNLLISAFIQIKPFRWWIVSAIVAKIAGKGSLTTHVNSGGDTKLLQELFQIQRNKFKLKIN